MASYFTTRGAVELPSTPDLKVSRDGEAVYLECTQRLRMTGPRPNALLDSSVFEKLAAIATRLPSGKSMVISIVGNEPSPVERAIDCARKLLEFEGEDEAFDLEAGFWIGLSGPGSSTNSRGPELGKPQSKRVELYLHDSHKFDRVLSSFTEKRQAKQLPAEGLGGFCIDLELTHLPTQCCSPYLAFMGNLLGQKAWGGGQNTRISGLFLTAWPMFLVEVGVGIVGCGPMIQPICRANSPLPDWLVNHAVVNPRGRAHASQEEAGNARG